MYETGWLIQWCQNELGINTTFAALNNDNCTSFNSNGFPESCKFKQGTSVWYGLQYAFGQIVRKRKSLGKLMMLVSLVLILMCNVVSLRVLARMNRGGIPVYPLQSLIILADVLTLLLAIFLYYPVMYFFGISAVSKWCFSWKGWALRQTMVVGMGSTLNAQFCVLLACWDRNQAMIRPVEYKSYDHLSRAKRFGALAFLAAMTITFLSQQEVEIFRYGSSQRTIEEIYCGNPIVMNACYQQNHNRLNRFVNYEWHNTVCRRKFRFPYLQHAYTLAFLTAQAAIVYYGIRLAIRYRAHMNLSRTLVRQRWSRISAGVIPVSKIAVSAAAAAAAAKVTATGHSDVKKQDKGGNGDIDIENSSNTSYPHSSGPCRQTTLTTLYSSMGGNGLIRMEQPNTNMREMSRSRSMNVSEIPPTSHKFVTDKNDPTPPKRPPSYHLPSRATSLQPRIEDTTAVDLTIAHNHRTTQGEHQKNAARSKKAARRTSIPVSERLLTTVVLANCLVAGLYVFVFSGWALCNVANVVVAIRNYDKAANSSPAGRHRNCSHFDQMIYAVLILQLMTNFFAMLILSRNFRHNLKNIFSS